MGEYVYMQVSGGDYCPPLTICFDRKDLAYMEKRLADAASLFDLPDAPDFVGWSNWAGSVHEACLPEGRHSEAPTEQPACDVEMFRLRVDARPNGNPPRDLELSWQLPHQDHDYWIYVDIPTLRAQFDEPLAAIQTVAQLVAMSRLKCVLFTPAEMAHWNMRILPTTFRPMEDGSACVVYSRRPADAQREYRLCRVWPDGSTEDNLTGRLYSRETAIAAIRRL